MESKASPEVIGLKRDQKIPGSVMVTRWTLNSVIFVRIEVG